MSKQKTLFSCNECSYTTVKWLGCCPECSAWGSLQEARATENKHGASVAFKAAQLVSIDQIPVTHMERMVSGIDEWDRVVGGGIMPGSLLIVTGDPGIGKSTLLLQICAGLSQKHDVHYYSTEESLAQMKQRAQRLGSISEKLLCSDQADLDAIISRTKELKPDLIVIDSIQNCYTDNAQSIPGSVNALREATFLLMRLAKENNVSVILTGHITKEGIIAGPKTLEHMVDAVFYLQAEDRWQTRVLRSVKNRFGTINELGFFEMASTGLTEVPNINEQLIKEMQHTPGAVLISSIEGSRPLLLQIQALTIESKLSMPQRVVTGLEQKQVVLIAAILEKYLHIKFSSHDIFFKVSGGFKSKSSCADLGIALALLSSYLQQPVPAQSLALAEISLTGQIQPINQVAVHAKEAATFGLQELLLSVHQRIDNSGCRTRHFSNVYDLLSLFSA